MSTANNKNITNIASTGVIFYSKEGLPFRFCSALNNIRVIVPDGRIIPIHTIKSKKRIVIAHKHIHGDGYCDIDFYSGEQNTASEFNIMLHNDDSFEEVIRQIEGITSLFKMGQQR